MVVEADKRLVVEREETMVVQMGVEAMGTVSTELRIYNHVGAAVAL